MENESERLAVRENESVRTRVLESYPFDSRILYIFLKRLVWPMAVAAAADAVSVVTSHTMRRALELHGV